MAALGKPVLRLCIWVVVALLAAMGALLLGRWLAAGPQRAPAASARLTEASQGLDTIHIEAQLHPDSHSMTVTQVLTLTSRTAESRDALVLRTWPNAFQRPDTSPIAGNSDCCPAGFSAGSLVMAEAQVSQAGQTEAVRHHYLDEAKTALSLPLSQPWQPGETLTVTLRYTVHFPHAMYRFGWWDEVYMAGQAFATPALWQDGAYRTDAYGAIGDPLTGECANYTLQLTVPAGYTCATTGTVTGQIRSQDGPTQYLVEAPAVRELGLVMAPGWQTVSRQAGGTLVQAYAASESEAWQLLDSAAYAIRCFSDRYGDYPYPTYTVCAVPMGVSGAEYPGLSLVAASLATDKEALEYAIVHETAHQWWYGLVGTDSLTHPWLDEALSEYSLLQYVQDRYGQASREALRQQRVEPSMRVTVAGSATPGAPLDYFETANDYLILVYGRATSLLCAVDDLLGGGLDRVLKTFAESYAFQIADRADLTRIVLAETGVDVEPLMVDYLDTHLIN